MLVQQRSQRQYSKSRPDLDGEAVLWRGSPLRAAVGLVGVEHGAHGLEPLVGQPQEEVSQRLHRHRRVHDLGVDGGNLKREEEVPEILIK